MMAKVEVLEGMSDRHRDGHWRRQVENTSSLDQFLIAIKLRKQCIGSEYRNAFTTRQAADLDLIPSRA